jgi:radical SAM superfamily enzyme YgiQ (UPF0313 family)
MYKTKRFRAREFSELHRDILEAKDRWPETRRIFLADGDAFALSAKELILILDLLNESFPQLSRVGTYVNASNVLSKSDDELKSLSARRLKIGYLGLESGNEKILADMRKGATAEQMIDAVHLCQENGIKMSVMVLTGLGGQRKTRHHSEDTATALNRMNPRYLSLLAVMPVEGTLLETQINRDQFTELTPVESLLEMRNMIERLELNGTIFRSNHASNYLALSGRFPQDKDRLLKEIDDCLDGKRSLRKEWERGL